MSKLHFKLNPQTGTLSENDSKKYFSTVGFAVFAFMFISYGALYLVTALLARFVPSVLQNVIFQNGISMIVQYGIALPIALVILKKLPRDVNPPEKLGAGGFFGGLCVAFSFMTVGNTIAQFIVGLLESGLGRELINPVESASSGAPFLVNLIFFAILAPIIEELVFRKVICDRLMPLGEGYAVVISAVIFGLVHGNFYQFFYAFLTGLLFSAIYVKTGRIRYTVIYHMLINFLGGVLVPWAVDKLMPIMTEEMLMRLSEVMQSSDTAAMEALADELSPYMLPVLIYSGYELIFTVLSIAGVFVLMRSIKKVRFREGLLPPERENKIANIFCNAGVAVAIAGFAVIFVVSLL
ncbi:MAG: CPBP family intramembrane metalloprotease [Clostridia bacterium]|nr:CPBP family intramembrane metalloprotease [Clostridia bacterium]